MKTLDVYSIFKSINGEVSPQQQGSLCTFIRLAGCNLRCKWCFGVVSNRRIPRIILSSKANKKIFDVKKGDKLLTFNKNKELVETTVVNVLTRTVDKWLRITIEGVQYFVTEEHPFFTKRGLIEAKDLQIGDVIFHSDSKDKISYKMKIANPMRNKKSVKKSVANRDYEAAGKKISFAITEKIRKGIYVHPLNTLSKKERELIKTKQSESKKGIKNPNYKHDYVFRNLVNLKRKVKEKIIKKCSVCSGNGSINGKKKSLIVHHKDGNKFNDNKKNLAVICKSCHERIHQRGYNFWKNERKDKKKLLLAKNGFKVEKIKKFDRSKFPPSLRPKPLKVYNFTCVPYNSYLVDYMWVHNCDTPYAQDPNNTIRIMTPKKIISKIETKNVVITGGEPLMQEEGLVELLKRLSLADYNVSVETNGSIPIKRHLYGWANWVADWKCPSSGMNNTMDMHNFYELGKKDIIKFVINDEKDFEHAIRVVNTMTSVIYTRYVHPLFAFSPTPKMKSDILIDMMKKNKLLCDLGAVFSFQIHKLVFPKGEKEI